MSWRQLDSGWVEHSLEPVVLAATLAVIPVLVIETEATSSAWKDAATTLNWIIWAIFAIEFAFVLAVAPRKGAALRAHWLDAAIVLVTSPLFGSFLSSLRLLRLARLLRLLRLGAILTRMLQRERSLASRTAFRFAALLTVFVVVIAGAAESVIDNGDFHSTWKGMWWAIETVTTVGYGDVTPKTTSGRMVAVIVMLFGIGFLSILTATIASTFVKTERGDETEAILAALTRLEAEVADMKQRIDRPATEPGGPTV